LLWKCECDNPSGQKTAIFSALGAVFWSKWLVKPVCVQSVQYLWVVKIE
jgi:hypothetical protein